jgi:preprotein translocase subunit SecD
LASATDPEGTTVKEQDFEYDLASADRILIQLPGVQDPERAKALIGKTALLEFKLVDDKVDAQQAAAKIALSVDGLPGFQLRIAAGKPLVISTFVEPSFEPGR